MHPPYDRKLIQRRILEGIERGETLGSLQTKGLPCARTVYRWAKEDELFAGALRIARDWRSGLRCQARTGPSFNPGQAEAFLQAVLSGRSVRDLVRRPEWPSRRKLNRWKRERPEFAAELARATQAARWRRRTRLKRYDEATADRIICRLAAGESLATVLADRAMPGRQTLQRWCRQRPEFDSAIGDAMRAGHRVRSAAQRKVTPDVAEKIVAHIRQGGTLTSAAAMPGMPCMRTLRSIRQRDPAFDRGVLEACGDRDEMLADKVLALAEAATPATLEAARARAAAIRKRLGVIGVKRRRGSWAAGAAGDPEP